MSFSYVADAERQCGKKRRYGTSRAGDELPAVLPLRTLAPWSRDDVARTCSTRGDGGNPFEREVKDAIALQAFVYVRCACRIHKTLPMLGEGRCGACHELCDEPATREEYELPQEATALERERESALERVAVLEAELRAVNSEHQLVELELRDALQVAYAARRVVADNNDDDCDDIRWDADWAALVDAVASKNRARFPRSV